MQFPSNSPISSAHCRLGALQCAPDRFEINILQLPRLRFSLKFLRDRRSGILPNLAQFARPPRPAEERFRQRRMITLVDQNAAHSIVDCFRNSAMLGRENRQSTRHRFEHRVRNPFLVPVATEFARMQENMRLEKFLAQPRLGKKTGEPHPLADAELARETSQLVPPSVLRLRL